jgi:hypothetical protein
MKETILNVDIDEKKNLSLMLRQNKLECLIFTSL